MKKQNLIGLILLVIIAGGLWWLFYKPVPPSGKYNEFAQCISSKGFTMYGADWCSHCQNEKLAFGDAFKFIPYVECPKSPSKCTEKNIKGYPTWVIDDGRRFEGELGLNKLSALSGCDLPVTSD